MIIVSSKIFFLFKLNNNNFSNKYSSTRPFTAFRPKQKIFKNLVSEKLLT